MRKAADALAQAEQKTYFVQDLAAPEKGKNTHDFRNPATGNVESFDFQAGVAREVPLYVAQRCEEIVKNTPPTVPKPFHISIGTPTGQSYDSADPRSLTLAELLARIRVKVPAEAEVLMDKIEETLTTATSQMMAELKRLTDENRDLKVQMQDLAASRAGDPQATTTGVTVPTGCVIAGLEELVQEALLKRAEMYPDGATTFNKGSKKSDMVAFLKAKAAAPPNAAQPGAEAPPLPASTEQPPPPPPPPLPGGRSKDTDDTSLV